MDLSAPIARRSDPATSHEAAREVTLSGKREGQLLAVLALVRKYPGKTSLELAQLSQLDRYAVARRLPELEKAGYISRGSARLCTVGNRNGLTWYASEQQQMRLGV